MFITTYQQAILAVIQSFNAPDASAPVEVGKVVYAHSPTLLDSHSSCPHNSLCLRIDKSDTFPFCEAPLSFLVGNTVLRANCHCGHKGE